VREINVLATELTASIKDWDLWFPTGASCPTPVLTGSVSSTITNEIQGVSKTKIFCHDKQCSELAKNCMHNLLFTLRVSAYQEAIFRRC
jgi:hypothetical protein